MSTFAFDHTAARAPAALMDRAQRALIFGVALQVALLIPSLLAYGIDDRLINGVSVWAKPLKFQLSLSLMLLTLLWLLPLLPPERRATRLIRWTSVAIAFAAAGEIVYIALQAARGRASHFNSATQVETLLYQVMGVGAVTMVAGCFVIGFAIARSGARRGGEGLRLGAAVGLMLGAALTLVTAGFLSSGESGHWVGGLPTDAGGLPLFGWSRTGGDLRVPHFFATHVMQALPLLGLAADRIAPARARAAVLAGAGLSLLVVAATFAQANLGLPFLR